ncbi:MAG: hypothetical protein R3C19_03270 [Planctomycetaceae bacterium]
MLTSCDVIADDRIQEKLFTRYRSKLDELRCEGFEFEGIVATTHSVFLLPLAVVFGLLGREIQSVNAFGKVCWFHPLMRSADGTTLVYPTGISLRYYTFFEDGSTQRTSNGVGENSASYNSRCQLYQTNVTEKSVSRSWSNHAAFCAHRFAEGLRPVRLDELTRFTTIQSEEDSPVGMLLLAGIGWVAPVVAVMATVARML